MLSDHLGSTSLTTDSAGNVISELRYKPWGEVRTQAGTTSTGYQFTGQYSYAADFGLLYYNARWYDPALSRFAQADSIVPGGVQGYDRYAYVSNNPLRYTDSSGHCSEEGDDWCYDEEKEKSLDGVIYVDGKDPRCNVLMSCNPSESNVPITPVPVPQPSGSDSVPTTTYLYTQSEKVTTVDIAPSQHIPLGGPRFSCTPQLSIGPCGVEPFTWNGESVQIQFDLSLPAPDAIKTTSTVFTTTTIVTTLDQKGEIYSTRSISSTDSAQIIEVERNGIWSILPDYPTILYWSPYVFQ